jgi:hypothetical protein
MMNTKEGKNTFRATATVVGVVYLAGFVVGIGGNILVQSILGAPNHLSTVSANSMMLAIGAILWLTAVAAMPSINCMSNSIKAASGLSARQTQRLGAVGGLPHLWYTRLPQIH